MEFIHMDFQSWLCNPFNIIGMITMKTNDENIYLNLNPNIKHKNEKKSQKAENNNTKCTKKKSVKKFHWDKIWKH